MKNFVISIQDASDRRDHISAEFNNYEIEFDFFDAITPHNLYESAKELNFPLFKAQQLSENEKSCLLSHYSLWVKAVQEHYDYIAIFEDDIYLSENSKVLLKSGDWVNVDILKIEKTKNEVLLKRKKIYNYKNLNFELRVLKGKHMGAGGYILSYKGALSLVNFVGKQKNLDHVDQIIFSWYKDFGEYPIYQINPVLCIQDCIRFPNNQKFDSTLQWRDKKKSNISILNKILREINRLLIKFLELPYKIKLVFNEKE